MKSFFTIVLFLGLTWFCLYWFGQNNNADRNFFNIPVVGQFSAEVFSRRLDIWDYASRGPAAIFESVGIKLNTQKASESIKTNLVNDFNSLQKTYQEKALK